MNLITLTEENLGSEHICCAISNNNDIQVASKKSWLRDRIKEGLVFTKGDVRGKCFIEYIPAEFAWAPIEAPDYMYIDCLWVSGQFKGKGYSNELLESCINDSKTKNKKGLVVLSFKKKLAFLSDPKFLQHKGFILADEANPSFELMYLPFKQNAYVPKFMHQVKEPKIKEQGFVVYYSSQCPFTAKYVPLIEAVAKAKNVKFKAIHFESSKEAQNAPAAVTSFCLFYNGEYVTNEIPSEKKFEKMIDEKVGEIN
ncbi:MAG: YoaP domain-containing protein [Treponema sp.]